MIEFKTMSEYRKHCKENGSHWFSRDTMNFFGSRIESHLKGGRWFIESQLDGPAWVNPERIYLLREIAQKKSSQGHYPIEKDEAFMTLKEAKAALRTK